MAAGGLTNDRVIQMGQSHQSANDSDNNQDQHKNSYKRLHILYFLQISMFTDKYKTEYNRLLTEILIETMHSILSQLKSSGKNFQVYGCEHPCSLAVYLGLYHSKGPHIIQTDEKDFDEMEQSLLFFNPHLKIHKLFAVDPWFPSQEITKNRLKWLYHAIHAMPHFRIFFFVQARV